MKLFLLGEKTKIDKVRNVRLKGCYKKGCTYSEALK